MRLRRPLKIAVLLLLAATVLAALVLRHYAQPERVAALLAEQARTRLGLELKFEPPARYSLWPRLRLQLERPRFALPGETAPLLALERLDVSLPWSSLRDSSLVIEELQLEKPQLELTALQRWLDAGDDNAAPPDLRVHLAVNDAILRRDGKALARGVDFAGDIDAQGLQRWWQELVEAAPTASALPPLPGQAQIKTIELDGVTLEGVRIESSPARTQ
jgi:AsmA family